MANLDFFAAETDQIAIVDFLFSSTDVRVFESYSEPDQDLREFSSTGELIAAFPLGRDTFGNGSAVLLELWSPDVMSELSIVRFALNPVACNGHTFRYNIEGGGLIQLYFGGVDGRVVTKSHFGHWSKKGAQKWDRDDGVNWESLKKLSNRIQYHIRSRLAVVKVKSCPVLPQAYELARSGHLLKDTVQSPWAYDIQPITEESNKPKRAANKRPEDET